MMNSKYNYEYETFGDMINDHITNPSATSDLTRVTAVGQMIRMTNEYSASGTSSPLQSQFLWNMANYLYSSQTLGPSNWVGFDKVSSSIYYWYRELKPLYNYDELCYQFHKYMSIANTKLPNVLSVIYIETLLTKYGLPTELFRFSSTTSEWGNPDFSQLDDFLVWRYLKDNTSTDYTGNEKSEGTGTSSSTTSDSGTGKQWNRSRPINYTTTNETTADSVQGQSSESSGTDKFESSDTLNRDTTNNTERERILTERRTTLLQFMKELTGVLDNWIADLVQSLNPCFVQEMGI